MMILLMRFHLTAVRKVVTIKNKVLTHETLMSRSSQKEINKF